MELIEGISHNMIDVFHDGVHSTYVGNGPVISQAYRNKLPGDNHGDLPCVVSTEIMAGMPDQILEITVAASKGAPDQILFANTPRSRNVGQNDIQTGLELNEHRRWQAFGEDVGELGCCRYMQNTDISSRDTLTDEVKIDLHMLPALMLNRV